ncbi:MAG: hypothetical protein APR53_01180 [Methanoculleus sp. SDB]|nr:MAG: hypothetical protein APR53_01180 [Methanoculleus sp. SDB]
MNYDVDLLEVTPEGDISPGERITVRCIVTLTSVGTETFPSSHALEAYTELEDLSWTYTILVNDVGLPITDGKRYLRIIGWNLAYPTSSEVKVEYLLEGDAPEVTATQEKIIFRLRQLDSNELVITNGETLVERTIINPGDIEASIAAVEQDLDNLRASLDEQYENGVNTNAAEEKYDAAKTEITKAKTASYGTVQTYLTNAETYLDEAEVLLDEAWADNEITQAQEKIDEVDDELTYWTVNRSMSSDSRVIAIRTQLDNAQTLLTLAKDRQSSGEYNQARIQAQGAEDKAAAALNASLTLRDEVGEGFALPNFGGLVNYLLIGGFIVIVAVVGILFYRRRTRWDELG